MTRRPDLDDLDREMRDHIEEETQEQIARGVPPHVARRVAIRKFGNPTRVKEDVRAVWVPRWADQIAQDLRDAARRLRRHPGFAFVMVAALALGIALPTAICSVVNAVLRPLSYVHPDRVVWLTTHSARDPRPNREPINLEILNEIDFYNLRQQSTSFDHLIAYAQADATIVADGEASRARVVSASAGFWEVSGARVVLGALPEVTDREAIVLSGHFVAERFRSDPGVIGSAVMLDGQQMIIAGVLANDFRPQLPTMVAHAVVERTHEIGIRLALGAERRGVVAMMVMEAMVSVVAGITTGIAAALGASRPITDLLYGVNATDPQTFVAVTLALMAMAFVACAAPALRAALVDPAVALRAE